MGTPPAGSGHSSRASSPTPNLARASAASSSRATPRGVSRRRVSPPSEQRTRCIPCAPPLLSAPPAEGGSRSAPSSGEAAGRGVQAAGDAHPEAAGEAAVLMRGRGEGTGEHEACRPCRAISRRTPSRAISRMSADVAVGRRRAIARR
eukprot:scaffold106542_cov48-Phaeocystis_antarctica.AAC.2